MSRREPPPTVFVRVDSPRSAHKVEQVGPKSPNPPESGTVFVQIGKSAPPSSPTPTPAEPAPRSSPTPTPAEPALRSKAPSRPQAPLDPARPFAGISKENNISTYLRARSTRTRFWGILGVLALGTALLAALVWLLTRTAG